MKDYLKKRIPEFQQGQPELDEYLEAAGEFLGDAKEAIDQLAYFSDYKKSGEYALSNVLKDKGINIPARINEPTKRRLLRDVAMIHQKNGTVDGIIHAIRLAGFTPEIRVGWLPSPTETMNGYRIDPVTQQEVRFDINKFVYTDMLYGDAIDTDEGVFFEGYVYEDPFMENKIGPLPIYGEHYDNVPDSKVAVAKTPYIIVRFEEGNATIVTDPQIDPETGEVYEYSTSEQFQLINDVLRYFLIENNRPTTIRIIVIISLQPIDEEVGIFEEYEDEHTYNPDGGDDLSEEVSAQDTWSGAGAVAVGEIIIGEDTGLVGTPSPFIGRYSGLNFTIGDTPVILDEVYVWDEVNSVTYFDPDNEPYLIPLRDNTTISFNTGEDSVELYGFRTRTDINPVSLGSFQPESDVVISSIPENIQFVGISFDNNRPTNTVQIGLSYSAREIESIPDEA